MAYADSDIGFLDVGANYETRYIKGLPGFLDLDTNHLVPVLQWKISGGQRVPLFARGRMSPAAWRRTLVPGEFFPDDTNTGVYDESILTVDDRPYIRVETPGTHFENIHFTGRLDIRAAGVTVRNCLFTGPSAEEGGMVLSTAHDSAVNVTIEDCTIEPNMGDTYDTGWNAFQGHGTRLIRVNVSGGVDPFGPQMFVTGPHAGRCDVELLGCWARGLGYYSPNGLHDDDKSHADVIQWHGGKGLTIRGCRLEGYIRPDTQAYDGPGPGSIVPLSEWEVGGLAGVSPQSGHRRPTATLMISPGNGTHGELVMEGNWFDHGMVGLNGGGATLDFLEPDGSRIVGNRIGVDWAHSEGRPGGLTVDNSFAILMRADHYPNIDIHDNTLWNHGDPWDDSVPNNRTRNG